MTKWLAHLIEPGYVFQANVRGILRGLITFLLWVSLLFAVFIEFNADLRLDLNLRQGLFAVNILWISGLALITGLRLIVFAGGRVGDWVLDQRVNLLLLLVAIPLSFQDPRAGGALLMTRFVIARIIAFLGERDENDSSVLQRLSPAKMLAISFLGMIFFGALLLLFPAATRDGQGATFTDAMFTMASATSVTGLIVHDTGTYFSSFGLLVIFLVMQIGAIGIMVLAGAFAVLVGGRLNVKQAEGFQEAGFADVHDVSTVDGLKRLVRSVTLATLWIEGIGAITLYITWLAGAMELSPGYQSSPLKALWWCIFHSVSAFCHAGFSLEPDSLVRWVSNPWVNVVFMVLITLGALGFPVLENMVPSRDDLSNHAGGPRLRGLFTRIWRRYHLQTKVVLWVTLLLNLIGMVIYLYYEYSASLAGLSLFDKVVASLFQSVTLRSAGFNTVNIGALTAPTIVMAVVFMFIGSAPASTGGGVRITTMTVAIMAVRTMLLGREDVELYGRRLPTAIVYRAIAIVIVAVGVVAISLMLVMGTQNFSFEETLFETVSAFGTVGLSMGITGELTTSGKWLMTFLMYFGRVGPLTLALAIGERVAKKGYRYPEGGLAVG